MKPKSLHVTYRAFASYPAQHRARTPLPLRITVEGRDGNDCERRIKAICREYCLPMRRTLTTMRRVRLRALV